MRLSNTLLPLLLLGASLSFAIGVTQPLMEVEKLYIFSSTPSLIDITAGLWSHGDRAIAVITALFSLVFPIAKLAVVHVAHWFQSVARWSMLDVLVVAIVIFAAKTSGLASAATKPGLWFFAISVVLTAIASSAIRKAVSD
jgi:paraquat-inducible protein A